MNEKDTLLQILTAEVGVEVLLHRLAVKYPGRKFRLRDKTNYKQLLTQLYDKNLVSKETLDNEINEVGYEDLTVEILNSIKVQNGQSHRRTQARK